jgi:hypothetical protein
MSAELEEKIRDDLAKAGMLSELRARKVFADAGWRVRGPGAYFDREEEKSREGDFYATRVLSSRGDGVPPIHLEFSAVAEVKKSERPWVVFKRPLEEFEHGCAWNNLIARVNLPCEPRALVASLTEHSLLRALGWEGAGIHESFKSPDQPSKWYSAFVSSLKWASHMKDECPHSEDIHPGNDESVELYFFQPLVVLDGRLFSAELDSGSGIAVTEIKSAAFRFEYASKVYDKDSFRVDLVTVDGLSEYIPLLENRQSSIADGIKAKLGAGGGQHGNAA